MRNGDYIPSRLEAQHDAANLLCGTKTQSNPESTVGVLAMAGMRCVALVKLRFMTPVERTPSMSIR